MGLPGFHTPTQIPLRDFLNWLTLLSFVTRLITTFLRGGGGLNGKQQQHDYTRIKLFTASQDAYNVTTRLGIWPKMFCLAFLSLPCLW